MGGRIELEFAKRSQRAAVLDALTEAFHAAPYFSDLFQDPEPEQIRASLQIGTRGYLACGGRVLIARLDGEIAGATVFLEPSRAFNPGIFGRAWFSIRARIDEAGRKLKSTSGGQRYIELCEEFRPKIPHLSVLYLGVRPEAQGAQVGAALISGIEQLGDRDEHAYVATLTTANVHLADALRRRGWKVEQHDAGERVVFHNCVRSWPDRLRSSRIFG